LVDQSTGLIVSAPAQRVEPSGQAKASSGVVPKVGEPEAGADQHDMTLVGSPLEIPGQCHTLFNAKLERKGFENRGGNGVSRIGKHRQKSGAAKQDGKAQPVMAAPQTSDDVAIKSVQMEIPGELFTRGVSTEAGKPAALIVSQMSCRHIVRNLQHLQRVSGRPKNNSFSFAKDMRENKSFCNMFRTVGEVHL
jgi:hypothetical protein